MKAIVQHEYGSPDTLRLEDVDRPDAGPAHVLVRVRAASVNAADWHVMRGDPKLARLQLGVRRPKAPVRGRDFAGEVAEAGAGVTHVGPGDEVFGETGMADGAFAEYVRAPAGQVAPKPAGLTFEQAAAVPLAGCTALQALRDVARVQPGQRLLVNGASGGVGTFAVQIGKALGAHVTAVCSTRNAELVGSLGADDVVDYTAQDVVSARQRFDVVLDLVGNRSLRELRRVLTDRGTLVLSGGGVFDGRQPGRADGPDHQRRAGRPRGAAEDPAVHRYPDHRAADCAGPADRVRAGSPGHRPHLRAGRCARRGPLPRVRARPSEGRRHRALMAHPPVEAQPDPPRRGPILRREESTMVHSRPEDITIALIPTSSS